MKILMVSGFNRLGGDNKMYLLGLSHLDPEEFDVHVAAVPRGESTAHLRTTPNITLHEMELASSETSNRARAGRMGELALAVFSLARLVWREKIDVIYTIDRGVSMRIAYLVSKITRRPLLYNMQIAYYLDSEPFWRKVIGHSSALSVSSSYMRKLVDPHLAPGAIVHVIPNAVRVSDYDPDLDGGPVRDELGIARNVPVIALAGRLTRYKGQEDLLRAAKTVAERHPELEVLFIGAPDSVGRAEDFEGQLRRLAVDFGLQDKVHFLGWRSDIDRLYAASDVVTMPSYEEAFGLVAAEGLAMRKPVIATDAGGVPEFIRDRDTGHLVPPRDPATLAERILEVLDDPEEAAAVAARGRAHATERLDAAPYAESMHALWRALAPG